MWTVLAEQWEMVNVESTGRAMADSLCGQCWQNYGRWLMWRVPVEQWQIVCVDSAGRGLGDGMYEMCW